MVVGRWGLEARRIGLFQRTPGNDARCTSPPNTDCPIALNALSVRRWRTSAYAWSAGLALGFGGGSRYSAEAGKVQSWDTFFGVGPVVGASFLLADWQHLAVAFTPQVDAVFFIPRGTGSKRFVADVRGLIEGEVHMGFIGLPALSVGLQSGLEASVSTTSKSQDTVNTVERGTATEWSVGFSGPQTLWGLVTNVNLRFYF